MVLPNLSGYSLVVVLITLLVGIATTTINSGKILGQFQVPANVLVWIHFILPMLAGFGVSLQQAGTLTALTVLNAIVTGIYAVIGGAAPGLVTSAAVHAHIDLPQKMAAIRARLVAAKPPANTNAGGGGAAGAAVATVLLALVGLHCNQTPAQGANDVAIGLEAAACVLDVGGTDVGAGKPWSQTIADVVAACGKYGVDEAKATGLLEAHRKAEIREGLVPRPQ